MLIMRARARDAADEAEALRERNSKLREIDRTKDEFVATVSHELRTPLTSIRGYLELMEDEPDLSLQSREFLSVIDRNSERLLRLVGDLLFVAQDDAGLLELDLTSVQPRRLMEDAAPDQPLRTGRERPGRHGRRWSPLTDARQPPLQLPEVHAARWTCRRSPRPRRERVDLFEFKDTGIGIPKQEQDRLSSASFGPMPRLGTSSRAPGSASRSSS